MWFAEKTLRVDPHHHCIDRIVYYRMYLGTEATAGAHSNNTKIPYDCYCLGKLLISMPFSPLEDRRLQ